MNDGKYIDFWHGDWNNEIPLKIKASRLFPLSMIINNETIADVWNDDIGDWDIKTRRPFKRQRNQYLEINQSIFF